MELQGQLADFPLADLLMLCVETLISGVLEVHTPDGEHCLFFHEGQLYHAQGSYDVGFEALWPLFELRDAPYFFRHGVHSHTQTLKDTTALLIERGRRLAAQWRQMRPHVASSSVVPLLTTVSSSEQISINEEDWPVLSCIDGQNTIREIAAQVGRDELTVCTSLLNLQRSRLVVLGPPRPRTAIAHIEIAAAAAPAAPRPKGKGLFSKILAALPEQPPMANPVNSASAPNPTAQTRPSENDDIIRLLQAG